MPIEAREDYLYVRLVGTFETREALQRHEAAVEAALAPEHEGRVVFDHTEATEFPEPMREAMWTWLVDSPRVQRAALVADRTGIQDYRVPEKKPLDIPIQPVETIEEAENWLRQGGCWRTIDRGGYVTVVQIGTIATAAIMNAYQADIAHAMAEANTNRVLFDNRNATPSSEELRALMYTWLTDESPIRRTALVANTKRVKGRVNRTAEMNRVLIQAFHDMDEAEDWLLRGGHGG